MEGSIGIKVVKTGKNQDLKKKNRKTYDAETSPTCRGSDLWGKIWGKIPKFKKKTSKKTKKRKLMVRTTHQHAEEEIYKVA